jgi:hypothetical protein
MATVQHLKFTLVDPTAGGLPPGQEQGWAFAEDAFFKDKAVVVTVQPNEFNNLDRTIEVTSRFRTTAPSGPSQQLQFTVKNVGIDPIVIYFLLLGTIEP